jgi:lipoprotein-anchoring transpeptidase ErfK/SrfK
LLAAWLSLATDELRAEPWLSSSSRTSSAEIVHDDEPLYVFPGADSKRRGAARLGARLPVFGSVRGAACQGDWLLVGAFAWICEERVRLSDWPFDRPNQSPSFDDGLPFRYHFVGDEGSFGYATLAQSDADVPVRQYEPGFSIAAVRIEIKPGTNEPFALTSHGSWVPVRDLLPANPATFEGVVLTEGQPLPTWVVGEDVVAVEELGGSRGRPLPPFSRVTPAGVTRVRRSMSLLEGGFVKESALRTARLELPPEGLRDDERWIDVDLESQTLVAYEGPRAVFATLVSTGRGGDGSEEATPRGEFRIWVKLLSTDMTNLEDQEASNYYAIEDVPWVMFFKDGYGLHGAFWHRSFGNRRSHGCVNLAPRDAQRLFRWASPRMPSGFRAVHPTEHDLGTRVVVH